LGAHRRRGGPAQGGKLIIYNRGTGGGINGLKNPSGKCEGPGGGGGVDGVKNQSGQWEGPGGGGAQRVHYVPSSH
jgi:hypothetical protein